MNRRIFGLGIGLILLPLLVNAAPVTSATWADGHSATVTDEELLRYAIRSPAAGYPEEAQRRKLTGNGVYELRIARNGETTQVTVIRTAGNEVLDQAAKSAFMKWRLKPGVFTRITIPVSWSVNPVH